MRIVLSYLQIDSMLKWLHVNMVNRDNECSGLLLCSHLVLNSQPSLTWGPFRNHLMGRHPYFVIFWKGFRFSKSSKEGSQILTILKRTSLANENLKVYTPPSDDFWMVPYPLYLFLAKLPAWFTWTKPVMLCHFGMCSLD